MRLIFFGFILSILWVSCVYNKQELPQPSDGGNNGDTLVITYNTHVKEIIDEKCVLCHSQNGSQLTRFPFLTTYLEVKAQQNRIQVRALDQGSMPPSSSNAGPLTQAEKDTLQLWLNQGALE